MWKKHVLEMDRERYVEERAYHNRTETDVWKKALTGIK